MVVGALQLELFIPESGSLKTKRQILKSVKERLRNRFNISLCEAGYQDKWQRTLLAIVTVGRDKKSVQSVLDKIQDAMLDFHKVQVIDTVVEVE